MILDTSALLAILLGEAEAETFAKAIEFAPVVRLSMVSYLEASIFVDQNLDAVRSAMLDTFLEEFGIRIEAVTEEQGRLARRAFGWFGKGRHQAALNFGDCFTWALAKAYREPVLYKGAGFGDTDIEAAGCALKQVLPAMLRASG